MVEGFVKGLDDEALVQQVVFVEGGRSVSILRDLLEDDLDNLLRYDWVNVEGLVPIMVSVVAP